MASEPGAATISLTPGSAPNFQARACSLPPDPTTRIRVGITRRLMPKDSSRGDRRPMAHRPPGPLDRLRSFRPYRYEDDRDAGVLLEGRYVATGGPRQIGQGTDAM